MSKQENQLKEFDQLAADVAVLVQPTMKLTVKSNEDSVAVVAAAKDVKALAKKIEERRLEHTKPLDAEKKRIMDLAKSILDPLEKAEAHLKTQLRTWEMELDRRRREEVAKAEEERKKKEAEARAKAEADREAAETVALFSKPKEAARQMAVVEAEAHRTQAELEKEHSEKVASINSMKVSGARKVWTFEVEDGAKIPREFLMVDEKKIREAIRAGVREIAGVKIFQETSIAVR